MAQLPPDLTPTVVFLTVRVPKSWQDPNNELIRALPNQYPNAKVADWQFASGAIGICSDGIETCDPDPCAVAEELEKLGISLTVHTVGFGLDNKGAVAQLQCLAEKTGGIAIIAENAGELEDALTKTVKAETEPVPPPPEPAALEGFPGHVVMAKGIELPEPFHQPTWEIFKSNNGEKGERVNIEYGSSIKLQFAESGDYIVRITAGMATIESAVTIVKDKPQKLEYSLEAGIVNFKAYMDEATPATDGGTTWQLLTASNEYVTTFYGPEVAVMLNAGSHRMALSLGTAKTVADVSVAAGQVIAQKMSIGAGIIQVRGEFSKGGQAVPEGATYELLKFEPNLDGSFENIETAYAAPSVFKVPAGRYKIAITQDYAKVIVDVEVAAGQSVDVLGNLDAGYLTVTSPKESTVEIFRAEKDLAGNRSQVGTEFYGTFNKALSAGTYFVTSKNSDGTPIAEKEFVVKAGARTDGTLP